MVKPIVIDLGWDNLKSAIIKLPDSGFVSPADAAVQRKKLVDQYVAAFRKVEVGSLDDAKSALKTLSTNISASVAPDQSASLRALVDGQIMKLV